MDITLSMQPSRTKTAILTRVDWAVGAVLLAAILLVGWLLFSGQNSDYLMGDVSRSDQVVRDSGTLTVAYAQPLSTYNATATDALSRAYLANSYEGLTRLDHDFNLQPGLALSWGMLDDMTWQFKLRPSVKFHDGSIFTAQDVIASLDRAGFSGGEVTVLNDFTIQIETDDTNPILDTELSSIWISPSELGDVLRTPVGTGPYQFLQEQENAWSFQRFDDYWGDAPSFPELVLRYESDKLARFEGLLDGSIDVLAETPPSFVDSLLQAGYPVASLPNLEVNFLLFNWENSGSKFRHKTLREAMAFALNRETVADMGSEFAHSVNQFVSRGVFGYNPRLEGIDYDLAHAQDLLQELGNVGQLTLDLPEGLDVLGDYVEDQLALLDVNLQTRIWPSDEYSELLENGDSDFYFLAWRSDLGDASDFFNNVVYENFDDGMDQLIERANRNVLESVRLEELQELMGKVVMSEVIGIPLFESDSLITIQPELKWEPRMDNLILAADFK